MPGRFHGGLGPRGFLTEEEKQNLPKVDKVLIKRILAYLKPYRIQFTALRKQVNHMKGKLDMTSTEDQVLVMRTEQATLRDTQTPTRK